MIRLSLLVAVLLSGSALAAPEKKDGFSVSKGKARLEVNRKYNAKRLKCPKINTVMDVPKETIEQLEALA